jgi:hypothetical protein
MNTAVQLRASAGDGPRSELLHGTPRELVSGSLGPVALFAPGEIVAYLLRTRRGPHLYVFRTLQVHDRLAASVPGVRPQVQLLIDVTTARRIRFARGVFSYVLKGSRQPSSVTDAFYLRVSAALAGRIPTQGILRSLLPPPTEWAKPWTY